MRLLDAAPVVVSAPEPRPAARHAAVPTRWRWATASCVALLLAAAAVFAATVGTVDPNLLGAGGLLAALHPALWVAYALVVVAFVVALAGRARHGVLVASTLVAGVGVYGLQCLVYEVARNPIAWLHWGLVDQIAQHGTTLTGYDVRFSWPGFFSGAAMLARAAGIDDPNQVLRWSPLVLGLLTTAAVAALVRQVLGDRRVAWTAAFVFTAAESVGQNYFAPQGLTYPAVLLVLALVVMAGLKPAAPGTGPPAPRGAYTWAVGLLVLVSVMLAPSHQLSPLFLALFLGVLTVQRKLRHWWLPAVPLAFVLAWWATGGREFWDNHADFITRDLGQVSSSVGINLVDRFAGDPARQALMVLRAASAAAVMGLGGLGWLVLLRRRHPARWTLAAWAVLPFGLLVAQSYGGEMLLRCFLFALPALAACAAVAVLAAVDGVAAGRRRSGSPRRTAALLGVCSLAAAALTALMVSTVAVRGQDDAFNAFSPLDRRLGELGRTLPGEPARVAGLTWHYPGRDTGIAEVSQYSLAGRCTVPDMSVGCLLDDAPDRVLISPAQDNWGQIMSGLPAGWTDGVATALIQSGQYTATWTGERAWVLDRVDEGTP